LQPNKRAETMRGFLSTQCTVTILYLTEHTSMENAFLHSAGAMLCTLKKSLC
jgi:hypothetical protein